jgi:hypothetical protein
MSRMPGSKDVYWCNMCFLAVNTLRERLILVDVLWWSLILYPCVIVMFLKEFCILNDMSYFILYNIHLVSVRLPGISYSCL